MKILRRVLFLVLIYSILFTGSFYHPPHVTASDDEIANRLEQVWMELGGVDYELSEIAKLLDESDFVTATNELQDIIEDVLMITDSVYGINDAIENLGYDTNIEEKFVEVKMMLEILESKLWELDVLIQNSSEEAVGELEDIIETVLEIECIVGDIENRLSNTPDNTDTASESETEGAHPGYAIIVAGDTTEEDWSQRLAIDHSANNVYRVLRNLGFDDAHIFYLNSRSQLIDGQNVVDSYTSLDNLRNSLEEIKNLMGDNPTPLILYLIGHGIPEVFDFYTESDALSSTELKDMLELFHDNLMLVVIGSCYSGSFITLDLITDSISAPNRIIITAAHDDGPRKSLLGLGGWYHSSDRFWGNLNKGLNIKDAFITDAWWGDQEHLWLDDNGDYTGSPLQNLGNDGELASVTTIGIAGSDDLELTPWYSVWFHSAGEVRVYDSQNFVTGLVNGEIKEEIPNSVYDEEDEIVAIFSPDDNYRYEIEGTETGTYGLNIISIDSGEVTAFTASEIPTQDTTIHQYTIDWATLSLGDEAVIVQIDSDGDGTFEGIARSDNELTNNEFMAQKGDTSAITQPEEPEPSPSPEPEPEATPEPTSEPEQGGIPGFPTLAIVVGVFLSLFILKKIQS